MANDEKVTLPAIDSSVVDTLRMLQDPNEPDLVAELMNLFLNDAPTKAEAVREGLAEGDATKIERAAHSLKSASANLGALPLSGLCARLEKAGRAGDLEEAQGLFSDFDAQLKVTMAEARAHANQSVAATG